MDVVKLLQELIKIPSLAKEEKEIADFLGKEFKKYCVESWVDNLNNVVGIIEGKNEGPIIMFNAHIDHANIGEMEEPFSGKIISGEKWGEDGEVVYGRGACDNKGAVASMTSALAELSENNNFNGKLIMTAVALEETGDGIGTIRVLNDLKEKNITPDIVLNGEATDLDICLGHRGKLEFLLNTFGVTAHSSNPDNGINAIILMKKFIDEWEKKKLPVHEILGKCTSSITNIKCKPGKPFIIPDVCTLNFDRRYLPEENPEEVKNEVLEVLKRLSDDDKTFKYNLEIIQKMDAFLTPKNNPFIKPLSQSIKNNYKEPNLRGWLFGTDGPFIVNGFGIPTIGFGPGQEIFAHTYNDHVSIKQLEISKEVYKEFVMNAGKINV
jgi:putative selenium metabolism hydrolase